MLGSFKPMVDALGQPHEMPLRVFEGGDGAGVVAHYVEQRVDRIVLSRQPLVRFGKMAVARGGVENST